MMLPICGRCWKPIFPENYRANPLYASCVWLCCTCPVPSSSVHVTITYMAGAVQYSEAKRVEIPAMIYEAFKDGELGL